MLDKGVFLQNIWVFGHEFGHGNQVAQMKGAGWAEVTNNIYAQQAMYQMNNAACRLEHTEFKRQGYNDKVVADRFNAYLNDAIVKKKPYLLMTLKKVNIIVLIRLFHWLLFGNYLSFLC